jgi:hypothetical protein
MKGHYLSILVFFLAFFGNAQTSSTDIRAQLDTIVNREGFRFYKDTATLSAVGLYIENEFKKHTENVYRQNFNIRDRNYFNVVGLIGDTTKPRIVVGAHYDVCQPLPGADDNGTGVVGLLQVMEQLKDDTSGRFCFEIVAYTLEEPPFFGSDQMGSFVHAESLNKRNVDVYGMVSVEMIGYFSDAKKSQDYPLGILKLFYGGVGDYITIVRKMNKGPFARKFSGKYKRSDLIRTKKFTGPKSLTGIDFSDHRNYWHFGYDAIMLTDTAFYRNKNYHQSTDTVDTIDFERMAAVIDGILTTLRSMN